MAEIRKFLFDNFIINGQTETKLPEPLPEIVEEETLQELIEENIVSEVVEEKTEEIVEEWQEEPFVQLEPEEKYTKEELNIQVLQADKLGYERGYATAKSELEAEANVLMQDISQKLSVLLAKDDVIKITEDEAFEVIKKGLQTLVPTLLEEHAKELVSRFLQDNFNNFKHNEKLSFYIHPDIISYTQDIIVKLANSNDFEGKISIHKDNKLPKSSCRVEWNDGGVEYNPNEQLSQVEEILDKQ